MSFEIKNVFLLHKIKDRNIFYNRSSVNAGYDARHSRHDMGPGVCTESKRQTAGIKARELATKRKTACEILPTMIFL